MNRNITNSIRFILDECIPPVIRDARWFMYPFFYIWYKGKKVKLYMDFKSKVYTMTEAEYEQAYRELDCLATDRPTDMNQQSIDLMISKLPTENGLSLLDVGCGRGHWLAEVKKHRPNLSLRGCDVHDGINVANVDYTRGNIEKLPFADKSFDYVTCHHTIEHLKNVPLAVSELKRVAKKGLFIVTPCQKYYYYTLDMHINFYPIKEYLQEAIQMPHYSCKNVWGDWVYLGYFEEGKTL